jgi:prepilin-type N-terminal cleavage/methylation domain-containing protein
MFPKKIHMFTSFKHTKKGFTLIELLVVIAIIGILSSVVLASLSTARQKSRDAKRISDIGQVRLALELFFDRIQSYPSTTPRICGPLVGAATVCVHTTGANAVIGRDAAIVGLADNKQKFLPKAPKPAGGGSTALSYFYYGLTGAGADCTLVTQTCTRYALGTTLERSDNTVLPSDVDQTVGAVFFGNGTNCGGPFVAGQIEQCYDMRP